MSARVFSVFIDETGDTDAPGASAVVGLLVEDRVESAQARSIARGLQSACTDLAWAIHASALNTPQGFLSDRRKRRPVVTARLEPSAAALERASLGARQLGDWTLPGTPTPSPATQAAAAALRDATEKGLRAAGEALAALPDTLGVPVTLVATVCGPGRITSPVEGLLAEGYVLALLRTLQTVAELAAVSDAHSTVHLSLLERRVTRADGGSVLQLGPTHTLLLAQHAARRARLADRVTFAGPPHTCAWDERTPAMLVLADHAANRFGHALRSSKADDTERFLARVREEVRLDASRPGTPVGHGLAHLDRTAREAPPWARRLPPNRDA
jgi:hypothetical protein